MPAGERPFGIPASRIRLVCGLRPNERITEAHLVAHVWWWRSLPFVWKHRKALAELADQVSPDWPSAKIGAAHAKFMDAHGIAEWKTPLPFIVAVNFCAMAEAAGMLHTYLDHWFRTEMVARATRAGDWRPACIMPAPWSAFRASVRFDSGFVADLTLPDDDLARDFLGWVERRRAELGIAQRVRSKKRTVGAGIVAYLEKGPDLDPKDNKTKTRKFLFNDVETLDRLALGVGADSLSADAPWNALKRLRRFQPDPREN